MDIRDKTQIPVISNLELVRNLNQTKMISITSYSGRPFFSWLMLTILITSKDLLAVLGDYGVLVVSTLFFTIFVLGQLFRIKECIKLDGQFLVFDLHRYKGSINVNYIRSIRLNEDSNELYVEMDLSTQNHKLVNFRREKILDFIANINEIKGSKILDEKY